jgi:hypothetical protein
MKKNRTHAVLRSSVVALLLASALGLWSAPRLYATPFEREIAAGILRKAGAELLERSARETAEHSAAAAIRAIGKESAGEVIQRGGLPLLHAAALHGDDLWRLARRVPETSRYLALKPAEALTLARRFGEDAVRLESRVAGMSVKAAEHFGPRNLAVLAKAAPPEVRRLVGYAEKTQNPKVRERLFNLWAQRGATVLKILDRNKTLILTGGLTMALLDVADGLSEAIPTLASEISEVVPPEAPIVFSSKTGTGLQWAIVFLSAAMSYRLITGNRKRISPATEQ